MSKEASGGTFCSLCCKGKNDTNDTFLTGQRAPVGFDVPFKAGDVKVGDLIEIRAPPVAALTSTGKNQAADFEEEFRRPTSALSASLSPDWRQVELRVAEVAEPSTLRPGAASDDVAPLGLP